MVKIILVDVTHAFLVLFWPRVIEKSGFSGFLNFSLYIFNVETRWLSQGPSTRARFLLICLQF